MKKNKTIKPQGCNIQQKEHSNIIVVSFHNVCKCHITTYTPETNITFFFWPHHTACEILVSQPGIKSALEAWSLNPWTTREVPELTYLNHH